MNGTAVGSWDAASYDGLRRRLVPGFDDLYGIPARLVAETCGPAPRVLDLGAGTGLLSAAVLAACPGAELHLVDGSAEMLERAAARLPGARVEVRELAGDLPAGPFDAVVSALAVHHLTDEGKRSLYRRAAEALRPGGVLVNAEQVLGPTPWHEERWHAWWLADIRAAGVPEDEVAAAEVRLRHDRCAPIGEQLRWLEEAGLERVGTWYQRVRFAVLAGWRPEVS